MTILEQRVDSQAGLVELGFEAIEQLERSMQNNGLDAPKDSFWSQTIFSRRLQLDGWGKALKGWSWLKKRSLEWRS